MVKKEDVSKGEEQTNWCFFYEEYKDLSHKFGVLMSEFDNLNKLFYEYKALEREEQQYRNDERRKIRATMFIQNCWR
jgi:hypothetical protein